MTTESRRRTGGIDEAAPREGEAPAEPGVVRKTRLGRSLALPEQQAHASDFTFPKAIAL